MTSAAKLFEPPRILRRLLGPLATRPRLASGIGVGLLCLLLLSVTPNALRWSTRAVLSWDLTCLWFMALTLRMMSGAQPQIIGAHAASQDEGRGFILGLAVIAAAASIAAIAVELSLAKADHGLAKSLRVALAFTTVAASWTFVQTIFALHYAHEYYAPRRTDDGEAIQKGLAFLGDEPPDYWDFLHFSVVIGVACQTADIGFTSRALRRIGTVHGIVAFGFNTVVLALTINLLAGLF